MNNLRSLIKEILSELSLRFERDNTGASHGQSDYELVAYNEDDIVVGYVTYSEYDDTPSVQMLEVGSDWKRKGIGSQLLKKLQSYYPDTEIDLGMLTDDGASLIKTMKREFVPNKKYDSKIKILNKMKSEKARIMSKSNSDDYSENEKLNDLHDGIYDLESELYDMKKGNWIFK